MCYSEEQSKKTFLINIITCYILYNYSTKSTHNKIIALILLFVGFMQLFDIIFWKTQNISEPQQAQINYFTTKIAMFFNHLQPIVFAYILYTFNKKLGNLSTFILFIYTISITLYTINAYDKIKYTLVNPAHSSLVWEWNTQENYLYVYLLFLAALLVLSYENLTYPINFIFTYTFVISLIIPLFYKTQVAGRFWCKLIGWAPLIFIILDKIK